MNLISHCWPSAATFKARTTPHCFSQLPLPPYLFQPRQFLLHLYSPAEAMTLSVALVRSRRTVGKTGWRRQRWCSPGRSGLRPGCCWNEGQTKTLQLADKEESSFAKKKKKKKFSDTMLSLHGSENQNLYRFTEMKSCKVFFSKTKFAPQLLLGKVEIWLSQSQPDGRVWKFESPC